LDFVAGTLDRMESTTAAVYARISTDKRKGTKDEGSSVANQLEACRAFIKRQGWVEGKTYRDNSISATSGALRPEFEQMLNDAPPLVVVWKQDRLERGVAGTDDLDRFILAGCEGVSVDGERITFDSASGELITRLKSITSGYETRLKSERQKFKNAADAKAGKWHYSRPVFGNDRKTGKLIPKEAEAIRAAAAALISDDDEKKMSFFGIAKAWNAAGLRTPESPKAGGKAWEPGTVRNFFSRPRLIGKRVYGGVTHDMQGWEPVLDEDTFNAIQDIIEDNKTGKRGVQGSRSMPHMLTGIATCGAVIREDGDDVTRCGKGLNIQYRGGKGSARAYRCTTPGHVSRVALPLESWIVEKFLYLLLHEGAEKVIHPEGGGTSSKLRMERVRLVKAHEAWLAAAVDPEEGEEPVSAKVIGMREAAHTRKLAEIDAQLLDVLRETSFAGLLPEMASEGVKSMWKRWETVPMDKKRSVIQSLFAAIVVLPGGQGARFKPKFVKLKATPLMMALVDLNDEAEDIGEEAAMLLMQSPKPS
jgi:site-specific DNA recombinase